MIIEMHNRVAISDEISLIGNLLCTEVLKFQQTFNSNMRIEDSIYPAYSNHR